MQDGNPITVIWSKLKPEVEFQYGGRSFFQTGNSYITDVDWVISTKFGLLIDINPQKRVTSPNPKSEVKFRRSSRHLEHRCNVITLPSMVRFGWNLAADARRLRRLQQNRSGKKSSNVADVCFCNPEMLYLSHDAFRLHLYCYYIEKLHTVYLKLYKPKL